MKLLSLLNLHSDTLHALPTVVVYITDRCNSRCTSCDYWRYGQGDISMELVRRLARELPRFGTRYLLLSGGEPLQHPRWPEIAALFKASGLRVGMATSGIMLAGHAGAAASCLDELFVSLDGATPETYRAIRGVDCLALVKQGITRLTARLPITIRTTVQRGNYLEIPSMIRLTRSWGARHHSFYAVNTNTCHAFARREEFDGSMALRAEDLGPFAGVLERIEGEFDAEFAQGYVVESKDKLRMMHMYFAALLGMQDFPLVRCNAPRFSAVIETDGTLKPCFFLPPAGRLDDTPLSQALNTTEFKAVRRRQRLGLSQECRLCVCPAFKGARALLGGL